MSFGGVTLTQCCSGPPSLTHCLNNGVIQSYPLPVKSLHARLCPFYFLAVNLVNCASKVQQLPKLSDQHFKRVHAFVWKCSLFPILLFFLILISETKFGKHFTIRLNLLTLMY